MRLLRAVLYTQAVIWAACGLGVASLPHFFVHDVFRQPHYPDYAYVRVAGVFSIGLALLMVLVAQRLEDVWWWSWAFIITTAGVTTVTGLHLALGGRTGVSNWLWVLFACVNGLFTVGLLVGMGRAAQEKPFV